MSGEMPVSARAARLLGDLRDVCACLARRIRDYDDELAALTRDDVQARASWKRSYGLRRMRWRGLARAVVQAPHNLKRTLSIVTATA